MHSFTRKPGLKDHLTGNIECAPCQSKVTRDYQIRAVEFARRFNASLIRGFMGCGKSRIAIDVIQRINPTKTLILCPKSVIPVWLEQYNMWASKLMPIFSFTSMSVKERAACLKRFRGGVAVINYDSAWREPLSTELLRHTWDLIICDEIHRIKSPGSKISRFMHRLGKRAKSRMGLSGTPIPQGPLDAYGIFRFLDPVIFGTRFAAFRARYAVMGGFQGYQVIGYQNMEEFNRKFGSITFHIEENAVSLPEYIDIKVPIQMPKNAWSAYHEMAKEFCTWLESGENVTAPNTLAKLMRLQQITSGFLPTETESPSAQKITQLHDAKAQAMIDIIADTDDPVVIFYRFSHDGHEIRKKLEKRNLEILEISGQQNDYDRFREGESRILLAQIQSASEGIDLTRCGDRPCNRAIYYSIGFISSASYKQSRARIRRPGQTETCFYHHLVVPGSIDETVYQNMDDKEKLIRTVYEGSHKLNIN